MANTIDKTTDEALLRSLIDGSIEEFEDDGITSLSNDRKFTGCNDLVKICLPNLTTLTGRIFNIDTTNRLSSLKTIDFPKLTHMNCGIIYRLHSLENLNLPELTTGSSAGEIISYCNKLKKIYLPKLSSSASFLSLGTLEYVVLPKVVTFSKVRDVGYTGKVFKGLDLGPTCTTISPGGDNVFYQTYCDNIEAFVIRSNVLVPLTKILGGASSATYFGTFDKNKIYVPQALVNEYKNATNWSTYTNCIEAIEGSIYENYYADGTPIGLSPYGLIGYYAVGESGRYEAIENVPSHINSSVDSDLVAYTATDSNPVHRANDATTSIIPDTYYQGYGKCSCLCVYSSDSFLSENDVITVEYSCAKNASDAYISGNIWGSYKNAMTASTGVTIANGSTFTVSGLSDKMFLHKLIEYHKDGTIKTYINGVLRQTRTVDASNLTNMNWLSLGHSGQSTAYLGPVAIYDRALTSDEIAEHYQFYVDNYMVGQTAYDSSGNFVGA